MSAGFVGRRRPVSVARLPDRQNPAEATGPVARLLRRFFPGTARNRANRTPAAPPERAGRCRRPAEGSDIKKKSGDSGRFRGFRRAGSDDGLGFASPDRAAFPVVPRPVPREPRNPPDSRRRVPERRGTSGPDPRIRHVRAPAMAGFSMKFRRPPATALASGGTPTESGRFQGRLTGRRNPA